jgi:hypothetical protein
MRYFPSLQKETRFGLRGIGVQPISRHVRAAGPMYRSQHLPTPLSLKYILEPGMWGTSGPLWIVDRADPAVAAEPGTAQHGECEEPLGVALVTDA